MRPSAPPLTPGNTVAAAYGCEHCADSTRRSPTTGVAAETLLKQAQSLRRIFEPARRKLLQSDRNLGETLGRALNDAIVTTLSMQTCSGAADDHRLRREALTAVECVIRALAQGIARDLLVDTDLGKDGLEHLAELHRVLVPQSKSRARVAPALAAAGCVAPPRNMPDTTRRRFLPADDDASPKPVQDFRTVARADNVGRSDPSPPASAASLHQAPLHTADHYTRSGPPEVPLRNTDLDVLRHAASQPHKGLQNDPVAMGRKVGLQSLLNGWPIY